MSYNGSGIFVRLFSWADDKANNIKIRSDRMDAEFDGIATALSKCILKDGQQSITDHIPWNGKRITSLGDATADGDALNRQTADSRYPQIDNDLSDLNSASTARTNLGLGALSVLDTVDSAQIESSAITSSELNADAVTTAKIIDDAVTTAKIADDAVTTDKIVDGAVTADKLAAGAAAVTGGCMLWMMPTPPSGWLECDGSAISRTTYADLFAVLGTTYGVGDGSTTFNLPDTRGRFPRFWDHGAGVDPDRASRTDRGDGTTGDYIGTKQGDQYKSHKHIQGAGQPSSRYGYVTVGGTGTYFGNGFITVDAPYTSNSGGNETRPKNINLMLIIKT